MFPWGVFLTIGSQAVNAIATARNNRATQQASDAQAAKRKAELDAGINENPLSRSENQHTLGQYDRAAQQQIENARGVANITGATPEYSLGVQKAVAEGRADLMGSIAAGASRRADRLKIEKRQAEDAKYAEDQARKAERNQTYANLAANAMGAAGAIIDAYGAGGAKSPAKPSVQKSPAQIKKQYNNLQTVTDETKALSERTAASENLLPGMEQTMRTVANNRAQQEAKLATGSAVASDAPKVIDPEPSPLDWQAHLEWEKRNNKSGWSI